LPDHEILIVTDFLEGIKIMMEAYNHYNEETQQFGKNLPERSLLIKSIYHFKSLLKSSSKNQ
jgi:hypothetical protein